MTDASAADDPRLWRQVATPFAGVHPGHRLPDETALSEGAPSHLWPAEVVWQAGHLDVPSGLLDLICASDDTLAEAVTQAGLLHYGLALRRMLSGRILARVERALGAGDWQRLVRAEEAFAALAVEPQWPLEELVGDGAGARIGGAGAALLAAAFAAHGEPWRLRLGLRLAPCLHEAVLAARACEPRLASRRLAWLAGAGLPGAVGQGAPVADRPTAGPQEEPGPAAQERPT